MKWHLSRAVIEVKRDENSEDRGPVARGMLVCLRQEVSVAGAP